MSSQWKNDKSVRTWMLPKSCKIFSAKFDEIQQQLQAISCMDDLLAGMLSKAKGQILRVAATLHVLFHIDTPLVIPSVIANNAVEAAIDLVDVCIQQAAYLAGRGDVKEGIEELAKESSLPTEVNSSDGPRSAVTSLLLPGKILDLKALSQKRAFRNSGNKIGAVQGFEILEENGLGVMTTTKINRGANMLYKFHKEPVPENPEEKMKIVESLMKFAVSITQYEKAYNMPDITMSSLEARKRPATEPLPESPLRRSPRKNT